MIIDNVNDSVNANQIAIRLVPDGFFYNDTFVRVPLGSGFARRLGDAILEQREAAASDSECIVVSVGTTRVLLIPQAEAYRADYMFAQTLSAVETSETILTQSVAGDAVLVYAISKDVFNFFNRTFEEVSYSHPLSVVVEQADKCAKVQSAVRPKDRHSDMLVSVERDFVDIAVVQNGAIQMVNRFAASVPENRLYYIMNVWQQLGMNQLKDKLTMMSLNPESKYLMPLLSKYIKNI